MCAKANLTTKPYNRIEDVVFNELLKLPSSYVVLRNIFLRLPYRVTHTLSSELVKACQIDFMVIGPPGVFVIEAKEWDKRSYRTLIPYKEVDKAGLIVYIKLKNWDGKQHAVFNILVTTKSRSDLPYGRVLEQNVWDLSAFIFGKESYLSKSEIKHMKRLFVKHR